MALVLVILREGSLPTPSLNQCPQIIRMQLEGATTMLGPSGETHPKRPPVLPSVFFGYSVTSTNSSDDGQS